MTEPVSVEVHRADARALERAVFVAKYPDPVLLLGDIRQEETGALTRIGVTPAAPEQGPRGAGGAVLLVPLRKASGASMFRAMITIGRGSSNDVRIRAAEVSKFHAFARVDAQGVVTLTDAGSTNGTKVAGQALKPNVEAAPLRAGDEVMLGVIRSVFHTPSSLYDALRAGG